MAALMSIRSIYVFTHDSIGLGEDGPTHQPIEHAAALRLIPNVHVWRPCDGVETAAAWAAAIERTDGPTALLLTRQGVPTQPRDAVQIAAIAHGGYVLVEPSDAPDAIVIATGSEVALAVAAANELNAQGARLRVVSMPCCERFSHQDAAYREAVLPSGIRRRIAIEAASADYWYKFVGLDGEIIALHGFGASAPAGDLFKLFGLTAEQVKVRIQSYLAR
jgi:transketolase